MLAPDLGLDDYISAVQQEPSESLLFLRALRAAKDESLKAFNKEDTNKKRLEERIRPFQLYVNEDTDNTGDCQFDAAADQLRGIAGHEHVTKEIVRKTVTDWLRLNPDYRLSSDPANTDTLSSWIRDTQGREWNAYVNEMAKAKVWGDEVTMKGIVEVYNVKILLWSSTVSDANYFSVHRPKADDGSEVATLCLCHFLEVHYGSLLSKLEYARRQAEKREAFIHIVQRLSADVRLDALCDVFLHDNQRPDAVALLDRGIILAALETSGGNLQLTFERLATAMGLSNDAELAIPLRRVEQYRAKLPPGASASSAASANREDAAKVAELQQELSKAMALVTVLKEEAAKLRAENAALRGTPAAALSLSVPFAGAAVNKESGAVEGIFCDVLVDEDGKKWLRAEWTMLAPQRGDMLTVSRVAQYGQAAKLLSRLPATGERQGVTLFEYPLGIQHVRVVYSRKGTDLVKSAPFLCGPHLRLALHSLEQSALLLTWAVEGASELSSSDWIGLYKPSETNMKSYEAYSHVDPATRIVTIALDRVQSKLPLTARYFDAGNKYYPVAELEVTIENL